MKYQAIAANSKIYFGQDIPNMFVQGDSPSKSAPSPSLPNADSDFLRRKPNKHWVHGSAKDRRTRSRSVLSLKMIAGD